MLKCITLDEDQCIHSMFLCETCDMWYNILLYKISFNWRVLIYLFFFKCDFFFIPPKKKKKNHVQESLMKLVAIMFAYSKMKYSIIYLVFIFYF